MELREQINSEIEEAVATVKKASKENIKIKAGLEASNNVFQFNIGNNISIPIKIDAEEPGERLKREDMPNQTFEP